MPNLADFKNAIARLNSDQNTKGIVKERTSRSDRTHEVWLACGSPEAVSVIVEFDPKGEASQIYLPNQSRSGGLFLAADPQLLQTLLNNSGRTGNDFLNRVARDYAGYDFAGTPADYTGQIIAKAQRTGVAASPLPLNQETSLKL